MQYHWYTVSMTSNYSTSIASFFKWLNLSNFPSTFLYVWMERKYKTPASCRPCTWPCQKPAKIYWSCNIVSSHGHYFAYFYGADTFQWFQVLWTLKEKKAIIEFLEDEQYTKCCNYILKPNIIYFSHYLSPVSYISYMSITMTTYVVSKGFASG